MNRLLESYQTLDGHFDELCRGPGEARPHWSYFLNALDALGTDELEQRRSEARRQILDNGVSYNVYGDPKGTDRPWRLDPIPVLLDSKEWASIEQALIQRAELLNLIVKDIYGPQQLLRKGLIPHEVIYKHNGFSRACCGIDQNSFQHSLVLYAADLVRDADGCMRVVSDRAQAPSGSGYALENRIVTSRVLPSLFRDSQVHRLALFFRTLRMTLAAMAPQGNDNPNIVILSPGPLNETYFEHAFLANYLGYPLVQGTDLTVRENQVFLRALDGLQKVDVILRRLDDQWCDPVELRPDSQLGIAGLLESIRCGNVTIANPLGSSVLENPGLMPFLPAVAKHFLGGDLRIPSVETWWCGNSSHLSHVLANFEKLVVKTLSPHKVGDHLNFPCRMNEKEKDFLKRRIVAKPELFVAQRQIDLSTVPTLHRGALQPRRSILRSFAVARDDAYVVMPGGLSRIAPNGHQLLISSQVGGASKDTWVLASEPEKQVSLWQTPERVEALERIQGSVSSRVAENMFWLGRYGERAEGQIRLIRTILLKWIDSYNDPKPSTGLRNLAQAFLGFNAASPEQIEGAFLDRIQDETAPNGVVFNLHAMVQTANSVRERLSSDTWYTISVIKEELGRLRRKRMRQPGDSLDKLNALIGALMAFAGLSLESLSRDPDWIFLDLGRRVERAQNLVALLRTGLFHTGDQNGATTPLEIILSASESLIAYRRRYQSNLHLSGVLELLLLDERHPRSLTYQSGMIQTHMADLPLHGGRHHLNPEEKVILQADTRLRLTELNDLLAFNSADGNPDGLQRFLSEQQQHFRDVADRLADHYFAQLPPARQLAPLRQQAGS